jgi:hypothetical protein
MNAVRIALAALAAVLGVALAWMTDWGADFTATPDVATRKVNAKLDAGTVLPDFKLGSEASAYAQIAERPLLNPTRRPAPTQPIAQVAPEPPKPQIRRGLYQLIGVTDLGEVKVAQVREVATRRVSSVRLGDALQELKVKKITAESVTLAFDSEEDVLALAKFTPSGQVPPPSTPPPVPPPQTLPVTGAQPIPPPPATVQAAIPPAASAIAPAIPRGSPLSSAQADGSVAEPQPGAQSAPGTRSGVSMRDRLGIGRNRPPSPPSSQ